MARGHDVFLSGKELPDNVEMKGVSLGAQPGAERRAESRDLEN